MLAEEIKPLLVSAMKRAEMVNSKSNILHVGAFIGKGFFRELLRKMGRSADRLYHTKKRFPASGLREHFHPELIASSILHSKNKTENDVRQELVKELNEISMRLSSGEGDCMAEARAVAIDCYLYAQDNTKGDRNLTSR